MDWDVVLDGAVIVLSTLAAAAGLSLNRAYASLPTSARAVRTRQDGTVVHGLAASALVVAPDDDP
jgi:hypothetical protein